MPRLVRIAIWIAALTPLAVACLYPAVLSIIVAGVLILALLGGILLAAVLVTVAVGKLVEWVFGAADDGP